MDNQNTGQCGVSATQQSVLILVLMDNQNTGQCGVSATQQSVLILVLMDNQNTFEEAWLNGEKVPCLNPCSNG